MIALDLYPCAKLNLFLKISRKREDGYHDIDTVFQTITLADRLKMEIQGKTIGIRCDNRDVPTDESNLITRAILRIREEGYAVPGMKIVLRKSIPAGSGLGGGSSDAAAVIIGMNRVLQLGMDQRVMSGIASRIGSDVSFFLWGGTAVGRGKGNDIYPLPQMQDLWVALAISCWKIDTARAYSQIDHLLTEKGNNNNITEFIYSIYKGKPDFSLAENDFEMLVAEEHGELGEIKSIFRKNGAVSALLTGSGSAIYGLFEARAAAVAAASAVKRSGLCTDCVVCRTVDSGRYRKRLFDRTNLE